MVVNSEQALQGRDDAIQISGVHAVNGNTIVPPFPEHIATACFGMGCFWGAERIFWQTDGVFSTAVGYAGGTTPNADYREVCSGKTGHAEVVLVAYDPMVISYSQLLKLFWENHDPTQGMRQGNDIGSQYRSTIYTYSAEQAELAETSRQRYAESLGGAGYGPVTTEIAPLDNFYYAEEYHQQYLHKNPTGYCGIGGTGVSCPTGIMTE